MRIGILASVESWERARAGRAAGHLAHSLERHARTNEAVASALAGQGHRTVTIPVDGSLLPRLVDAALDLVFNTYFGPGLREDQARAAALLEFAGLRFTGGGAACHYLGLSKPHSKRVFTALGIPTPQFVDTTGLAPSAVTAAAAAIGFPLIVKTSAEGEGIGLDEGSVVRTADELDRALARLAGTFAEPPLVERFLPGREFTVGVLDGTPPAALPVLELEVPPFGVCSYAAKVSGSVGERCPADLEDPVARLMGDLAVRAGRALGCRDYWRVDFRMDADGAAYVLEVNTLPGLMPAYSDFPRIAEAAGIGYRELVSMILAAALR